MPLFHCNFFSETLLLQCSMDVIIPQPSPEQRKAGSGYRYPVLYLLHGLSDDHSIWQRRTSIERYLDAHQIAAVMPAVNRSFYTDMASGPRYWTFISEELPALARWYFPLSAERDDNFVAGLSMGGYGAFKLGLSHPERFAAAASLSGAVDILEAFSGDDEAWLAEMRMTFGDLDKVAGSPADLFYLARQVASSGPQPRLYQCCGTEDFLYQHNIRFRDHARSLGLDLTYEEGPGEHEWGYWDRMIQNVLNWLPIRKP